MKNTVLGLLAISLVACATPEERYAKEHAWELSLQSWEGRQLYEFIQHADAAPYKSSAYGDKTIVFFGFKNGEYQCTWNMMVDEQGAILKTSPGSTCNQTCIDVRCQHDYLAENVSRDANAKARARRIEACNAAGGTYVGYGCQQPQKPVELMPMPTIQGNQSTTCNVSSSGRTVNCW